MVADKDARIDIEANFIDNAQVGIRLTKKAIDDLTGALANATTEQKRYNDRVDQLDANKVTKETSALQGALGALNKLGIVPVVDALGLAKIAIEAFKSAVVGTVGIAAQFEQWGVAFETMLGSAALARQTIEELTLFAARTPFQIPQVMESAKQLMAVGFSSNELIPTLKMLGDVAAGLSVPIERLVLNFGQIKTQTYLTGRELRDFTIAGVPLVAALAEQLGVSEAAIKKMVEQGKIGFKEVEKAFIDMSSEGGRFENLMDKQAKTLLGTYSNLKDQFIRLGNEIGQSLLAPTKLFAESMQKIVQTAADSMHKLNQIKVVSNLAESFQDGAISVDQLKKSFASMTQQERETASGSIARWQRLGLMTKQQKQFANLFSESLKSPAKKEDNVPGGLEPPGSLNGQPSVLDKIAYEIETADDLDLSPEARLLKEIEINKKYLDNAKATADQKLAIKKNIAKLENDIEKELSANILVELKERLANYTGAEELKLQFAKDATAKTLENEKLVFEDRQKLIRELARIEADIIVQKNKELQKSAEEADKEKYDALQASIKHFVGTEDEKLAYAREMQEQMLKDETLSAELRKKITKDLADSEAKSKQEQFDKEAKARKEMDELVKKLAGGAFDIAVSYAHKKYQAEQFFNQSMQLIDESYNDKKKSLLDEFNSKTFATIEDRKTAEIKLALDLSRLEQMKLASVEAAQKKRAEAEQQVADMLKDIVKKSAIDLLRIEAEKAAGWYAAQMALAVAAKNPVGLGMLIVGAGATAAAFGAAIGAVQGLATGGIVAGEGLYRMGEQNKKEAVIPLESRQGQSALEQAFNNTNTNNYQNITLEIDGMKLAEIMTNKQEQGRRQGRF